MGEKNFIAYEQNKLLRRAVEREMVGRRIVDLRNSVIHGYDKVDDVIIWGVIKDLPKLKQQADYLLGQMSKL